MNMREEAPEIYKRICEATTKSNKSKSPITLLPIGTERLWGADYYVVKIAMPDVWVQRSRVVYEQTHNCKLSKKTEFCIWMGI